jgi:hypothetical protein
MTMISNYDFNSYHQPDNVDWTRNDLIFVNRDSGSGGIWSMRSNGSDKKSIGKTVADGESTGILDISQLFQYPPSMVMITTNQGSPSSMTILLNPDLEDIVLSSSSNDDDDDGDVNNDSSTNGNINSESCPTTTGPDHQVFDADDESKVELYGASVSNRHGGYCGSGYIDFDPISSEADSNNDPAGIMFNVADMPILTGGSYRVTVRYSNGAVTDRPGSLFVDGADQNIELLFKRTPSWSDWDVEFVTLQLEPGRHTIELWWDHGTKRPNINWLSFDIITAE